MADGVEELNISDFHDQIKAVIESEFTELQTVDMYQRENASISTPAFFFELESIDPSESQDRGTEQFFAELRFSGYLIVSYKVSDAKLALRVLASNIARFIHKNKFGSPVTPAEIVTVSKDEFNPESDAYEIFRIEWMHEAALGESIWKDDGSLPQEVWVGVEPEIGPAHVDDYELLEES